MKYIILKFQVILNTFLFNVIEYRILSLLKS